MSTTNLASINKLGIFRPSTLLHTDPSQTKEPLIPKEVSQRAGNSALNSMVLLKQFPSTNTVSTVSTKGRYIPDLDDLPPYNPFQTNEYDPTQPEKDGLQKILRTYGYDSMEHFLTSEPDDKALAAKAPRKNPEQEAVDTLRNGGAKKIDNYIRQEFQSFKDQIDTAKTPEEKKQLAKQFQDEMETSEPYWQAYYKDNGLNIISKECHELDKVSFDEDCRYSKGGPWAYTVGRERWQYEWTQNDGPDRPNGRLTKAKENVKDGVTKTVSGLTKQLHTEIQNYMNELNKLAN